MIIKQYLLTTKHLTTEKWFSAQYSPGSSQWKTKGTDAILGMMASVTLIVIYPPYLENSLLLLFFFIVTIIVYVLGRFSRVQLFVTL